MNDISVHRQKPNEPGQLFGYGGVVHHSLVFLFAVAATLALVYLTLPAIDILRTGLEGSFGLNPDNAAYEVASIFFLIAEGTSFFVFFLLLGWMGSVRYKPGKPAELPFVSIIIPGFNEQETINKSIESALAQHYPCFEVIVVDDGSHDFTPSLIEHPEVRSIVLPRNGGKAEAVNAGIGQARGELILFSDSDSFLHPETLRHLVPHFGDERVGSVAGKIVIRQRHKLLVLWQAVEYIFAQALVKVAQIGSRSSITVAPGPICMYRRRLLVDLGGFKKRTLVEDFDMTLEVVHAGYKAVYEPRAIAWTSAPEDFGSLGRQRIRWDRGNLQVWRVYRNSLFDRRLGTMAMFWLPYLFIFGFGIVIVQAGVLAGSAVYFALSPPQALEVLAFSLALIVLLEIVSFIQFCTILYLDGSLRPSLVLAAATIKPYLLFLFWIRLLAMYREAKRKELSWAG